MHKIHVVSNVLLWVFRLLLVLLPISLILFWVNAPLGTIHEYLGAGWASIIAVNYAAHMPPILDPLTVETKLIGLCISLIPFTISALTLILLIKLFKNYAENDIFSLQNAIYLKRIGWVLLIGQLLGPVHQALLSAAMTWHNPPGYRMMTISLDKTNFAVIIFSVMVILISWIMAEAYKDREVNKLII